MLNFLYALGSAFWVGVVDVVVSLAIYFITKYAAPSFAEDAKIVILALQGIFGPMILALFKEDVAAAISAYIDMAKISCPYCGEVVYSDEVEDNKGDCPHCGARQPGVIVIEPPDEGCCGELLEVEARPLDLSAATVAKLKEVLVEAFKSISNG